MKLEIGRFNLLEVKRLTSAGAFLTSGEEEILLPRKHLPAGVQPGMTIRVFIYRDSEDQLTATTLVPKAQVGEFAFLEVTDTSGRVGTFLDWGLDKELLVPFSEQPKPMRKGERHLVRLYLDNSGRIAASARIEKFLQTEKIPLKEGEEVELMIHALTMLGAKVVINGLYPGLLFKNELHGTVEPGTILTGYVKKIREDGKVDVTLRKGGGYDMDKSRDRILMTLAKTGGFLPLGDKSPPEEIAEVLNMSKKTFKRAVGSLYREGFIDITEAGIKLHRD